MSSSVIRCGTVLPGLACERVPSWALRLRPSPVPVCRVRAAAAHTRRRRRRPRPPGPWAGLAARPGCGPGPGFSLGASAAVRPVSVRGGCGARTRRRPRARPRGRPLLAAWSLIQDPGSGVLPLLPLTWSPVLAWLRGGPGPVERSAGFFICPSWALAARTVRPVQALTPYERRFFQVKVCIMRDVADAWPEHTFDNATALHVLGKSVEVFDGSGRMWRSVWDPFDGEIQVNIERAVPGQIPPARPDALS